MNKEFLVKKTKIQIGQKEYIVIVVIYYTAITIIIDSGETTEQFEDYRSNSDLDYDAGEIRSFCRRLQSSIKYGKNEESIRKSKHLEINIEKLTTIQISEISVMKIDV